MQASRRVFNPTSLPGFRPARIQSRDLYSVGNSLKTRAGAFKFKGTGRWASVRRESGEAGEDKTGHISAGANEGILFFDNLSPLKLNALLHLPWHAEKKLPDLLYKFHHSALQSYDPLTFIKRAIPSSLPIKVTEILPRLKDGGAFVKFSHPEGISAREIEGLIRRYLKENPIKPWFSPFRRVRTNLVVGKPWLEDLHRFPSHQIRVEFVPTNPGLEAAELSQETLYSLFRKYGKLAEISSQPSDSKILPKFAYVDFAQMRHSIMARNCLHGLKIPEEAGGGATGTVLRLSYAPKVKAHWIRDWIVSHPRVFLPIAAALVAAFTVAVFDPIRTFFIKARIEHVFHIKDNRIYQWFKSQATDLLAFRNRSEGVSLSAIWDDRKAVIDQIQTWLIETAGTFIVVQGPRGSGKKELVFDQTLMDRSNTLLIDCKPIQEARGDAATIKAAAVAVGYYPVFSWMNSLSSLVDLAAQGTFGVKSGFSETLDTQLDKIWQNTSTALKQIALHYRKKDDKDAKMTDDDWLEAHPECRPVVVIDNFLHKHEEGSVVYDKISEWAAGLTTSNVAHVIFLTTDISYSKSLSKALPDRVFRQISLGDISPQVARKFVINHLNVDADVPIPGSDEPLTPSQRRKDLAELDQCIEVLGGRLTDLEFFARRLKAGQSPQFAVTEIIDQSASEILKMYLLAIDKSGFKWSTEQAWFLIKSLATQESIRYNEALLSNTLSSSLTPTASNGEAVLEALSNAELISIKTHRGRPTTIKAGKPVYQAAFEKLTEDRVLKSRLDLALLSELTKIETRSIDKYETELNMLSNLQSQPREVGPRVRFLLGKLAASQGRVEAWEREMGMLKKVLSTEE